MQESNCLLSYKNTAIGGGRSGVTNIQLLSSRCSRDKRSCVNLQQSNAALLFQPPQGTVKKSSQLAELTYFLACCFCSLLALSLLLLMNPSARPPPADSPEYADTTQIPWWPLVFGALLMSTVYIACALLGGGERLAHHRSSVNSCGKGSVLVTIFCRIEGSLPNVEMMYNQTANRVSISAVLGSECGCMFG